MIYDFEFANEFARDYGLMICDFNGGKDIETVSAGAEINFNPVSVRHGTIQHTTDVTYDSVLETTFQVCKQDCTLNNPYFDIEDCRAITRWLNREDGVHMLRLISDEEAYDYVQFEGSFNVSAIKLNDRTVGFELHFISNRPFAIGPMQSFHFLANDDNGYSFDFMDTSDRIGYIYPITMQVRLGTNTTSTDPLIIKNYSENRETKLYNCSIDETITFTDSLTISTDSDTHHIQNDFNYKFFRIANSYNNRINTITVSHPCEITFEYYPMVKGVGL